MIKAIFFDIDGTLIPLGKQYIPQSTLQSLHELQAKGIKLFIASGRPKAHLAHLCSDFTEFPWDGYVLFNGQYCCDGDGTVFHQEAICREGLEKLIPWVKENQIPVMFFEMDHSYSNVPIHGMHGKMNAPIEDPIRALDHETYQLGAYIPEEQDDDFVAHSIGIKSARWTSVFADIIPADGGKPAGLERMLKRYGFTREECMAFGDAGNDITMLEYAGIGVIMGNAEERYKTTADYVTTDIDDDGIRNALLHFGVL